MTIIDTYETTRIRHQQAYAQRDARKKYNDSLTPAQLAQKILERCNLDDINTLEDLENRLLNQALTLDSAFFTSMHEAGLGQRANLSPEALKMAIQSQRLCRQTFDILKKSEIKKTSKQTIEPKKC